MNERELNERLGAVPVPEESRTRAAEAVAAATGPPKRRRWRIPLAAGVALLAGFAMTAPGAATVDWVAGVVHLKASDATTWGDLRAEEELLGEGTTPEGTKYRVGAYLADGRICVDLSYPEGSSAGADIDGDGQAACPENLEQAERAGVSPFGVTMRRSGGVVGLGVLDPAVVEARVHFVSADGETGEGIGDVFPLAGTQRGEGGSPREIESAAGVVVFLPPGAGDLAAGSQASVDLLDDTGEVLETKSLSWARRALYPTEEFEKDPPLVVCGDEGITDRTCVQAESGELGRVERYLARPIPADLATALESQGYSFTPATDEDRSIAGATYDPSKLGTRGHLPGTRSLSYSSLGRLSGPGLEARLVYLVHNFRIAGSPGSRGGTSISSDASDLPNPPPSLTPRAQTRFFDAGTFDLITILRYP